MNKIHINKLEINNAIASGSFGEVFKCSFNGKQYAFKKFYHPEDIMKRNFIRKMNLINKFDIKQIR